MKQVYREIYKEYINDREIYTEYGTVQYGEITKEDNEVLSFSATSDVNIFKDMIKSGEVKSREFEVITRFNKDILKRCDWDFSYTYDEKNFYGYRAKKYIKYCKDMTIKQLYESLPAEQYLEWCADHGLKIENIKLEF